MDSKIIFFVLFLVPQFGVAQDSVKRLQEVEVHDKKNSNFSHLRQVDGMKITAGKKSEVINVEMLTVNKSTNNTRQVYAKVAGLNIFENDGSGLQLSIGGRGLDPNRTSNFNVRQNGYDISADALGYPESYYTPPTEALKKIEIMKGAASLQFGSQFGGLLNFVMKQPEEAKVKLGVESRQTVGSWGFLGSYNSVAGTTGKLSYFAYFHYKRGNGWRPNSNFESLNTYADLHYHFNEKHMIGLEYTHLNYLSQQPGGLDDKMFEQDPRQSNRSRNWFAVNWNLLDLEWDYNISSRTRLQTRAFSLLASRDAIGFRPSRPSQADNGDARDLMKGDFQNIAIESRLMHRYTIAGKTMNFLTGMRAYRGYSTSQQGNVTHTGARDFSFHNETTEMISDYEFPNQNYSAFAEQIIRITDKWNVTPGVRAEYILTEASGSYQYRGEQTLTGVYTFDSTRYENRNLPRAFVLGGIGSSYKIKEHIEVYGNISQNYRSVTFNDMQIVNASFRIDPNIRDEKGWSADLGVRGSIKDLLRFDANVFYLYYGNRIGEYQKKENSKVFRERGNIGVAQISGVESFLEMDILKAVSKSPKDLSVTAYSNLALTNSEYTKSPHKNVAGKNVEYVPLINWKAGLQAAYKKFRVTYQFSHLSDQYTDATNAPNSSYSAVNGLVPAYSLMDLSLAYTYRRFSVEASINNLANASYFTRRATGYPGPGIIPGDGRGFFVTVGYKNF